VQPYPVEVFREDLVRDGGKARHRDPLRNRRTAPDAGRERPRDRSRRARAGRIRHVQRESRRARVRRIRDQPGVAAALPRRAVGPREGARLQLQLRRRAEDGARHRRDAVGSLERLPRDTDQRRGGRLRRAEPDRQDQPPLLFPGRDAQRRGQALDRRGRRHQFVHRRIRWKG
jgi:hypothetical protein